jgi:signal transduction histidine kinase
MTSRWQSLRTKIRGTILLRGESAIASIGIAGASILLAALAACGWWTLRAARETQMRDRTEQTRLVGALLAQSAEPMLQTGDLSSLRRLVVEAARTYQLERCRVVLAEDQVIADAQPSRINVRVLPVMWSAGPAEAPPADAGSHVALSFPLRAGGRGAARLEIAASLLDSHWAWWQQQSGIALIGAASLAALLLVYRRSRASLGAVGAVGEALLAVHAGETATPALLVNERLGVVAAAWNRLLEDRAAMKKQSVAERTIEHLEARRGVRQSSDSDAAWDAIPQGLVLVNADLTVNAANGAAAVLLKRRREEIPRSPIGEVIKDEAVLVPIRLIASGAGQRAVIVESERQGDSGVGVLRFSVRPVRKHDTAAAMLVIEDITQQRVAEQARNAFIAQVTHELRTPLTNIRLYVETAIEDGEANPAVRANCLNIINGETRRLERIVTEMLSVSEIEAGSFQVRHDDLYMDVLLDELKADFTAQAADKKITFEYNRPPKLPRIKGDRDKIALALHNLVGNAMKYTPAGGKVTMTADVRNNLLAVDVVDTGIGISAEESEKVFDKFYRSSDPRVGRITGTGLGLTLAREVVRLHGGDVTLQSQLNVGSTFSATLPVPAEAA